MCRIILLVTAFFLASTAAAEPRTVTFDVETPLEVITGVGLLLTPGKVIQKEGIEILKGEKGTVRARFSYDSVEVTDDTLASVMLFTSEGDVAVGTMKRVSSPLLSEIPVCPPVKSVAATAANQLGLFQSLVSVRSARRENAAARVREFMKPDFIVTLEKLEKGFGFTYSKELSPDLGPLELIDRLSRIVNAIKNYRSTKPK